MYQYLTDFHGKSQLFRDFALKNSQYLVCDCNYNNLIEIATILTPTGILM